MNKKYEKNMKNITITFFLWTRCTKYVKVPNEYELKSQNLLEIVEDLKENFEDQFDEDITSVDSIKIEDADFDFEETGFEYISDIEITDDNISISSEIQMVEMTQSERMEFIEWKKSKSL